MNIFVGCSSRDTTNQDYIKCAEEIGRFINNGNHTLVFGGCKTGLMGVVYSQINFPSKYVTVVMAKAYEDELKTLSFRKPHYSSNTVNERKSLFTNISDVLVFIPGGIGTLDEIFSTIEAKRAHEHNLPIIIVNINGYFTPLLNMLNKVYLEGFADVANHKLYTFVNSTKNALDYLNQLK